MKIKRKKKYWSIKDKIYSILIVGGILCCLTIVILFNRKNRIEKLENDSFETYGTIEKLSLNVPKGTTTRKDIVYFYFVKNDTVFHKIEQLPNHGIEHLGIKLDECYSLKVVDSDYEIFDINFKKRKDTVIDKRNYQVQIYKTANHRNIIE